MEHDWNEKKLTSKHLLVFEIAMECTICGMRLYLDNFDGESTYMDSQGNIFGNIAVPDGTEPDCKKREYAE